MYGGWLYFETPECYLVSLDATTGKERWYKQLAPVEEDYFCSTAPLVVGNHVYAGIGGDARDIQGWLDSLDPETGDVQWRWYTTPQNPGDPGYDTWPDDYSRKHGGGGPWQPLTYDPELNLIYVTTGNPNPVGATQSRPGDNLFTCSIVALNADTGKMAWYYQTSPHDSARLGQHGGSGVIRRHVAGQAAQAGGAGSPQRILLRAGPRDGRTSADHAAGRPAVPQLDDGHQCERAADYRIRRRSRSRMECWSGRVRRPTGLRRASIRRRGCSTWARPRRMSMMYLVDTSDRPEGYGYSGGGGGNAGERSGIRAIDYHTGQMKWMHEGGGPQGLLTTAGGLLFGNDGSTNFCAFDAATGKILWHTWMPALTTNGASDVPARWLSVHRGRRAGYGVCVYSEPLRDRCPITMRAGLPAWS